MFTYNNKILLFNNRVINTVFDLDAQAYITAANITDSTEQNAVNQFVIDLKGFNLWSKIYCLHPYLGSSSSSCSYNLINPVTFQITWFGGVTFSSLGIKGNGTNGYGNTGFNPAVNLTLNNSCMFTYSADSASYGALVDYGCGDGTVSSRFYYYVRTTNNRALAAQYNTTTGAIITATNSVLDGKGFFVFNRRSSTIHRVLRNNVAVGGNATSGGTLPNFNAYICSFNNGGVSSGFSARQFALNGVSQGLTATEETNLNTAVQTFITTLGRNV